MALVGCTASGKSELALGLAARRAEAELVSVDSMSVYRHMDIGTAKPSREDRARVPHHLLDIVDPCEEFTVRQFQEQANQALAQIEERGHRALLVAGTALYLRAVVDELRFPGRWPEVARALQREADRPGGLAGLHSRLARLDPPAAARIEPANRRRLVRALEVTIGSGRRFSSFGPGLDCHLPSRFGLVGLEFEPELHDACIESRFGAMLDAGLVDEVRDLAARPGGISRTARQALGYREVLSHIEQGVPLDEAVSAAVVRTKAFARRQWAWFRRDPRITWLDPSADRLSQLLDLWDASPGRVVGD
jgi:tRNA dimethylallyltransferase